MEGRQIVAETSYKAFKGGDNGIHKHKIFSIWGAHKYEGTNGVWPSTSTHVRAVPPA